MTDFERLLDSSPNPTARSLLRAGLKDAPPPHSLLRAASALGLGASALVVTAPAAASANVVVTGAVAAGGKASMGSGLSLAVLSKWLVVGAASGVLVSGTVVAVRQVGAPARANGPAPTAVVAREAPHRAPPPARTVTATAVAEAPAEAPPDARSTMAPSPASSVQAPSGAGTTNGALGAEAARVDAARRALARGDFGQALAELDAYQRTRALGVLDREALVLRIQVLVAAGEHERGLVLARSYLRSHPADAYTARLEELIANGGKGWPAAGGIDRAGPGH